MPNKIAYFFVFSGHLVFMFFSPQFVFGHRFCSLTYINEVYAANCAYRGRVTIPQDLDPAIKILILSHNNLARIDEDSFSNYNDLVELYLNDNTLSNSSFHRNALLPLIKLRILDISNLRHHGSFNISWAPSIEKLTMNKNRNQYRVDLSKISKLEMLNAIDCSLSYFPLLNESSQIEEINLSKNPLNHFSVSDLSSLCRLRSLYLEWTDKSTLNGSERWCDCLKIETWLKMKNIKATELNCTKTSFTCEVMVWRRTSADNSVCDVSTYTGFLMANCSGKQLVDVPQDLDSNIEFLFLTNNTFPRLNENSFARYPNLVMLSLQNTTYLDNKDPINYNTFRSLQKLELLLFNEISTPFNFSFHLPPSLRLLSVNHNKYIRDLDLSDLKKLQDLHALTYTLRDFPKFHPHSPVTFLDLRGNPMDSLSAEDLAPFCTLDFLSLEWPQDAVINGSDRYCQCQRLENWMTQFNIGSNGPLNCTPPSDPDAEPCNLEYSEDILSKRRDCFSRMVKTSISMWFWIISCVVMFGPLIVVTFRETKTHQRLSLRSTTTTRKPGKFPNAELIIDVDEDFADEDEDELDFFDVNFYDRDFSKVNKETSFHIKQQNKPEDNRTLNESPESDDEEEEEEEEEDEYEYEEFVRRDGKFEVEKYKGGQKRETRSKDLQQISEKRFVNSERKPSLQVKPHEDFEDQFDVDLLKYEKYKWNNKTKSRFQVEVHKDSRSKSNAKSPKKEQIEEKTNFDQKNSEFLKRKEDLKKQTSKMSPKQDKNEFKFNDSKISTKDEKLSLCIAKQCLTAEVTVEPPLVYHERLSDASGISFPINPSTRNESTKVVNHDSRFNSDMSPLWKFKGLLGHGNPRILAEGTPKMHNSLNFETESLESNKHSAIIAKRFESIDTVGKKDEIEEKKF